MQPHTAKTEVCISCLRYAPYNCRGMNFIPLELQGAYPRYGIHTSIFTVYGIIALDGSQNIDVSIHTKFLYLKVYSSLIHRRLQ